MIHIYTKTEEELNEEQSLYDFGARVAKGIPRKACPTYLIRTNGERVDTWDLTEDEILGIIEADVADFKDPKGTYKANGINELASFKLFRTLKDRWTPSYEAILRIYEMEKKYGHIMMDILGSIDKRDTGTTVSAIVYFQKETAGDYTPATREEIMAVVQQLAINEKKKSQMVGLH